MNYETYTNELKQYIYDAHKKTLGKISSNIYRGHVRSLSTDIENAIALFVSKLLPSHEIYIDPSVYVNKKTNRPDIIIVNNKKQVVAMLEIKTQMGYCRNAEPVINKIKALDKTFAQARNLVCKFSNVKETTTQNPKEIPVQYPENVKLFLISFTDNNCNQNNHTKNKEYANSQNVNHFILFRNWYDEILENFDIETFAEEISKLN